MTPSSDHLAGNDGSVDGLLRERRAVQEWLHRLGEHEGEVPSRVVARVREDYQGRLERVIQALSAHESQLRAELERQRAELATVTESLERALDEVAEAQLRHRIGELGAEEWSRRRPELDDAVERSREVQGVTEREVERLQETLAQIESQAPSAPPSPRTEVEIGEETQPWEPLPVERMTPQEESPSAAPDWAPFEDTPRVPGREAEDGADELGFLEKLDRAIASTGAADDNPPLHWDDEAPSTPPPPGVKCPECGYTNDVSAWYCGVCGAELK